MLIVLDSPTQKETLFQLLQTHIKQFQLAVTFLTGYFDIFINRNKNNRFCFPTSVNDKDFDALSIPLEAYELESLNEEYKQKVIKKRFFTEGDYPFLIKKSLKF